MLSNRSFPMGTKPLFSQRLKALVYGLFLSGLFLGFLTYAPCQATEYAFAPVSGSLTSRFGWRTDPFTGHSRFHGGIDIAAPTGSPVYVPQDGVVIYSGPYGGYGNVVVVQHSSDLFTLYGHNAYLLVGPGQRVGRGQVVALVGSTGRSTGPHLHFEVRQGQGYVNPIDYLQYLQENWAMGGYAMAAQVGETPVSLNTTIPKKTIKRSQPRRHKKHTWSVEMIKGDQVEMVDF